MKQRRDNSRILSREQLFPKSILWNRACEFQLKYEKMNHVFGNRAPERQQASNRKGVDFSII
jgi:hypothetical protein